MMRSYKATTSPEVTRREIENLARVRRMAAEGMVLLKNQGALPLELSGKRVALFGNGARHTVRGGTGSGMVNVRRDVTVEQGLQNAGASIVSQQWLNRYDQFADQAKKDYFAEIQAKYPNPEAQFWMLLGYQNPPTVALAEGDLPEADCAIYVLSRICGEGGDRKNIPGDYQLSDEEKSVISALGSRYGGVTVVLNVGGALDTAFLREEPGVKAVLLMGQAGSAGGDALADVLTGAVPPSGRLTATWAQHYDDYPNAENFSSVNGNTDDEYYNEGIYVGYRWFDSFGKTPAYPFGYGLSYTDFALGQPETALAGDRVTVKVPVKNTGGRPGRQVVQLYVSAPAGQLPKPCQELRAFAKTGVLMPGETETATLEFPVASLASYDTKQAAWVLEPGEYVLRVGAHSLDTQVAAVLTLSARQISCQLRNVLPLDCDLEEITPPQAAPAAVSAEVPRLSLDGVRWEAPKAPEAAPLHPLTRELTDEELATLCVGSDRGQLYVIGQAAQQVPGAAGETATLSQRGVRGLVMADGPAGLRLSPTFMTDSQGNLLRSTTPLGTELTALVKTEEPPLPEDAVTYYQYCTAIPIATVLAQTWDEELLCAAGDLIGGEMEELGVDLWLAPGMNIQRNPLCGRNFEYYSEDPLLSGKCAAAIVRGVQRHPGRGTTIKHFCCNNQEDNRAFSNSHVSERALREIYLKGFEIAVKESQPVSLMTSYNLLNGVHTANNRDLLTKVLREEWGFQGFVMTDWGTTSEPSPGQKVKYPCSRAEDCVAAGNDVTMPGAQADVERILQALAEGRLARADLEACASRVLNFSGDID